MNTRIVIFCDNESVMNMVNNMTSKKPEVYGILILDNLMKNRRVFVHYIESEQNQLADSLSRLEFIRFWQLAPTNTNKVPETLPDQLWPIRKVWCAEQ